MNEIEIDLRVEDAGWDDALEDPDGATRAAVVAALDVAGVSGAVTLDVLLTDDEAMRALNAQWRGRDAPTNILSFPAAEAPVMGGGRFLGDLVLAKGVMVREAGAAAIDLSAHYTHLIIHGVLHLLGHDHEEPEAAERMESLEVAALAGLGIANPYTAVSLP